MENIGKAKTLFYIFIEFASDDAKIEDPKLIESIKSFGWYGPDNKRVIRAFMKTMDECTFSHFVDYCHENGYFSKAEWCIYYTIHHETGQGLVVDTDTALLEPD